MGSLLLYLSLILILILPQKVSGQINITSTIPVTENFDGIGSSAGASLPSNWKMSPSGTSPASPPYWSDVGNFTTTNLAASSGTPATGGRYNWGKTGGADRSIGFISSSVYKSQNSIMAWYRNTGPDNIVSLTISYDLFQFRIFSAQPVVSFYYSTDGTTWTSFSAGDAQTIDTSATSSYNFLNPSNFGKSIAAGTAAFTITGLSIPVNGDIYLRWNVKTVGSSNSEGLGLDNVSVTASFCNAFNVTGLGIAAGNGKLTLSWANPSCFDEILVVAATHTSISSVPSGDGTAYSPSSIYAGGNSGNNLSANEFSVYKATGSTVTVTGLNNGTPYYFKVFTRRGTLWSTGVTINGTPVAPFTGAFRSKTSGNWTSNSTWEKFSGGTWVAASVNEFPNDIASDVTISSGNIITLNGAGPYLVNSLTVASSGKLYTASNTGSNTYIVTYGNITCNGEIGNSPSYDDISFTIESSTCTISGAGTFSCSRIRKQWTSTQTNLFINMDITTRWSTNSSTQLYNFSAGVLNITINAGITFTCTNSGNVSIDGVTGADATERKGTLNIYGTLNIPGILYLTTNNTGFGNGVGVNIYNGGVINTNAINASASGIAGQTLHIYSGGKLNITGTTGWSAFSTTNNTFLFDTGSIIEYSATGDQVVETGIGNYSNLILYGTGNKTPNNTLTVTGNLDIQNNAVFVPPFTNQINLAGNWTSYGNSGFAEDNSSVTFNGSSTQNIICPGGESFYNLQINKSAGTVNLDDDITVMENLVLTKGTFVTNNNLMTWANSGGTLSSPNTPYAAGNTSYSDSYICTCDATGNPITSDGSNGFRINNVSGNSYVYFPVGADLVSANRMSINMNDSGTSDFTVVLGKGDLLNTPKPRVNRIWYISSSGTGIKASMRLYFTKRDWYANPFLIAQDEIETGYMYDDNHLVQKDYTGLFVNNSLWPSADVPSYIGAPYNTEIFGQYTLAISPDVYGVKNGINNFSRFSVVNANDIILPVTVTYLKAWQQGSGVNLEWKCLNELNIDHYEIQKSNNGINFSAINSVSARNNGNPDSRYTGIDVKPFTGNNFYRIKTVGKDNRITYTEIVLVNLRKADAAVNFYPNPVYNKVLNIEMSNMPAGKYNLSLYNIGGQKITDGIIENPGCIVTQQISLPSTIVKGIYLLKLFNDVTFITTKIVVQ